MNEGLKVDVHVLNAEGHGTLTANLQQRDAAIQSDSVLKDKLASEIVEIIMADGDKDFNQDLNEIEQFRSRQIAPILSKKPTENFETDK